MTRTGWIFALSCTTFACATLLPACAHASTSCSNPFNLIGSYGVLVSGNGLSGGTTKYLSGVLTSDRHCTLTGSLTGGLNGVSVTSAATGTYNTNPDGTMSITLTLAGDDFVQSYIVGVSTFPGEAQGIETDGSAQATIDMVTQKFSKVPDNSSLSGLYSASCISAYGADLNAVTFDGAGGLSGVDVWNNQGDRGNAPYTGNYTVNPDGSFTGTLNGDFAIFTYYGTISQNGRIISYAYNQDGFNGKVSCTGHKD